MPPKPPAKFGVRIGITRSATEYTRVVSMFSAASVVVINSTSSLITYFRFNSASIRRNADLKETPLRLFVTGVSVPTPASSMAFLSSWISIW